MAIRRVDTMLAVAGVDEIRDMPLDATIKSIDLYIHGEVTIENTDIVLTPEGYLGLIQNIRLDLNGKPIKDMTGYELHFLNGCMQGEIFHKTEPIVVAASEPFSFLLRIDLQDPRPRFNPARTLLNTREFRKIDLIMEIGANTHVKASGGTLTIDSINIDVYYNTVDLPGIPVPGGPTIIVERYDTYALDAVIRNFKIEEARKLIRGMVLNTQNATPAHDDAIINTINLQSNGVYDAMRILPWGYLKDLTTLHTGLSQTEIFTGFAYFDFDPKSEGDSLIRTGVDTLELEITRLAPGTLRTIMRKYTDKTLFVRG